MFVRVNICNIQVCIIVVEYRRDERVCVCVCVTCLSLLQRVLGISHDIYITDGYKTVYCYYYNYFYLVLELIISRILSKEEGVLLCLN
jgi:hypothetical protein